MWQSLTPGRERNRRGTGKPRFDTALLPFRTAEPVKSLNLTIFPASFVRNVSAGSRWQGRQWRGREIWDWAKHWSCQWQHWGALCWPVSNGVSALTLVQEVTIGGVELKQDLTVQRHKYWAVPPQHFLRLQGLGFSAGTVGTGLSPFSHGGKDNFPPWWGFRFSASAKVFTLVGVQPRRRTGRRNDSWHSRHSPTLAPYTRTHEEIARTRPMAQELPRRS